MPTGPRLFEPGLIYPSDETGPYVELEGDVVELEEPHDYGHNGHITAKVVVRTDRGVFTGWYEGKQPPHVGCRANIRLYNSGGGWYPDDVISGWWTVPNV